MELTKHYIGDLIELVNETNSKGEYGADDVRGMTITKEIIPTKADVTNTDLSKFLIVHPEEFVFNPRTHGKRIGFGYNNSSENFIISWNNIAFRVKSEAKDIVLPSYLFLHFNRDEWDREACFRSWGSSTEVFSWDALCEMKLTLPSIAKQRKYVDVYLALQNNLAVYQSKVEKLRTTFEGYIENLRKDLGDVEIAPYIRNVDIRNSNLSVTLTQGVDVNMQFIPAKREAEDQEGTKIVRTGQFAFNKVVKSNGTKLPIALRDGPDCVVSSSYEVFEVIDKEKLLPGYLMLWMSRSETHRLCGFKSHGTTRDVFPFDEFCKLRFPIPNIGIQKNVVNIYQCYIERQRIAAQLKEQLNNLCPILIKGSLQTEN